MIGFAIILILCALLCFLLGAGYGAAHEEERMYRRYDKYPERLGEDIKDYKLKHPTKL